MTKALSHRQKRNSGEHKQYIWRETHPPIISQDVFGRVQRLLGVKSSRIPPKSKDVSPFAQHIFCGDCDAVFERKPQELSGYWMCSNHEKLRDNCLIRQMPEPGVEHAFFRMYHRLHHRGELILNRLLADLQSARKGKLLWDLDIVTLNQKTADITCQDQLPARLKQQDLVDPDIFISHRNELAEQLRTIKLEKERFLEPKGDQAVQWTQELLKALEAEPDFLDAFGGELLRELVDKIIVKNNDRPWFRLIDGPELTESVKRAVR